MHYSLLASGKIFSRRLQRFLLFATVDEAMPVYDAVVIGSGYGGGVAASRLARMIAYGHSDLSARLGIHLDLEHPTFKAAVRRIAEACNKHGKLARGSAETEAQIEEYWRLGCKVLNLPGNDVSTYLDGLKARAGRAHARLKSIGVPMR